MEPAFSQNSIKNHIVRCSIHIGQVKMNPLDSKEIWSAWQKLRTLLEQQDPPAKLSEIKQAFTDFRKNPPFNRLSNPCRIAFYNLENAATSRYIAPLIERNVKILGTGSSDEDFCSSSSRTRWDARACPLRSYL